MVIGVVTDKHTENVISNYLYQCQLNYTNLVPNWFWCTQVPTCGQCNTITLANHGRAAQLGLMHLELPRTQFLFLLGGRGDCLLAILSCMDTPQSLGLLLLQ